MEIYVHFRVNSTTIDPAHADNAVRLREISSVLQNINRDSTLRLVQVSFCGEPSPEGNYRLNRKLAKGRLSAIEQLVRREISLPDSIVCRNDSCVQWNLLKSQVERSDMPGREKVLSILDEEARSSDFLRYSYACHQRLTSRLKQLSGGKVWRELNRRYFSGMRNASVVFVTQRIEPHSPPIPTPVPPPVSAPEIAPAPAPAPAPVSIPAPAPVVQSDTVVAPLEPVWIRHLHLKTNAVGWGMAIANVAAEVDLARHWSFTLPIYFSGWDYFKSTIKMRTFAIQPEVRYWLTEHNDGLFAGAHFGMAYYNVAFDGEYRYQDYSRETPALGGGVSVGYRLPIDDSGRWRLELTLGFGVYALHYNKFLNTPDTKDGILLDGSVKKTFWGIDRVAVSFAYTFDIEKKGAGR